MPIMLRPAPTAKRVLGYLVPRDVGQLGDRKRAKFNTFGGRTRFDRVSVIDTGRAGTEQVVGGDP